MRDRLERAGVEPYGDAIVLIRSVRAQGLKTALVSASENTSAVLAAARATDLFDVTIDGLDLARSHLRGKPAPDAFLEAAARLGSPPLRTVIFEDAIAGVQAGRAGGFGLVIGVDRIGHGQQLRQGGADVVVTGLDELVLSRDERSAERP